MKKLFYLPIALMLTAMPLVSCSDDDDDNNQTEDVYKDRSYGQNAIDACANVVSALEDANQIIANAKLTQDQ